MLRACVVCFLICFNVGLIVRGRQTLVELLSIIYAMLAGSLNVIALPLVFLGFLSLGRPTPRPTPRFLPRPRPEDFVLLVDVLLVAPFGTMRVSP